jgi:hypothetical protein
MQSQKVKLLSGWSNPGGSTVHHIALTNLLNENGYDCTFYGPHDWHLDKCKSKKISNYYELDLKNHEVFISHFVGPIKVNNKSIKHILSCHETNLFQVNASMYDAIHFVSEGQKSWHKIDKRNEDKCFIIPPIVDKIDWVNPKNEIAGVIGSIDSHKQTHQAIISAIALGAKKVYLYGLPTESQYYNDKILPFIQRGWVELKGHSDDKKAMYNSVSFVCHASIRETYGLVEAECKLAGINFIGRKNNPIVLSKKEILEKWKTILES